MGKKVAIITGERSGSFYAGLLKDALIRRFPSVDIRGTGEGIPPFVEMEDVAVVGVLSAVAMLPKVLRLFKRLKHAIVEWKPDLLVFVDFPDFNLFLGRSLLRQKVDFPMVYFIPPTVWAWRHYRVNTIRKVCRAVFTLFEFEAEYYRRYGVDAVWEGHPLVDVLKPSSTVGVEDKVIGLLPGSRRKELENHLSLLLDAAETLYSSCSECRFLVSVVDKSYRALVEKRDIPMGIVDDSYELMRMSQLLVGASGTVTVEAAILHKPMVVVYRSSFIDKFIFDHFVHTKFIAMPNIVVGRKIYPELIQDDATAENISKVLLSWLNKRGGINGIRAGLKEFNRSLGSEGVMDRIVSRMQRWLH